MRQKCRPGESDSGTRTPIKEQLAFLIISITRCRQPETKICRLRQAKRSTAKQANREDEKKTARRKTARGAPLLTAAARLG
jgi:hypothetical protein